jgi:hypothetical protein
MLDRILLLCCGPNKNIHKMVRSELDPSVSLSLSLHLSLLSLYRYAADIISDDPEFAHKKALRHPIESLSDSVGVKRRIRFSSLPWSHRQLIRCTKETLDDRVPVTHPLTVDYLSSSRRSLTPNHLSLPSQSPLSSHSSQLTRPSVKLILDRFSLIDALIAAYEAENKEAEDILLDMITPPKFEEQVSCHSCERIFSITLFRHHCRHCGESLSLSLFLQQMTRHRLFREIFLSRTFQLDPSNSKVWIS